MRDEHEADGNYVPSPQEKLDRMNETVKKIKAGIPRQKM
jgi:hypothetical protein